MDWTAEKVHELVKDWPADALPVGKDKVDELLECATDAEESAAIAHAFVGSGLAWLTKQRTYAICGTSVSIGDYYSPLREWDVFDGKTLLEAVSAAVLAAKQNQGS